MMLSKTIPFSKSQLSQIFQVLHNIAIAEFFRDGCSDPRKLLEVIYSIKVCYFYTYRSIILKILQSLNFALTYVFHGWYLRKPIIFFTIMY
jgi:hypothetical protein